MMIFKVIGRCICIALFIIPTLHALRMSPAVFVAQNVPLGEKKDLNAPLVLSPSEGESPKYFIVEVLTSEQTGRSPIEGFEDIKPEYFEVEGKQPIFVDTIQPAVRRLYSLIPDDPSMFNRRFMVQLRVMQSNSSSNVQSAIIGNYLIETQSNNFVRTGGNPISIAPSVLDLDSTGEGVFKVFNNDTVPHFIICYSAIPEIEPKGVAVSVSPGYSIGDPVQFVASQQSFIIEPDSEKKLFISMPNEEYRASVQGKVEAILWIKDPSNTNSSRFIRLHWNSE